MMTLIVSVLVISFTLISVAIVTLLTAKRKGWEALDLPISQTTYIVVDINHVLSLLIIAEIMIAALIVYSAS